MLTNVKILDVRAIPSCERQASVFAAFDALPARGRFILLDDRHPKPLLQRFISQRSGQFEWNVLRTGPDVFRVQIERRVAPGSRGVAEYLQADHVRLHALVSEISLLLAADNLAVARTRIGELSCGLEHHMVAEEVVLFPTFERGMEMPGVSVMHDEHRQLREVLGQASDAVAVGDAGDAFYLLDELLQLLRKHNTREEDASYLRIDQTLDDREREVLVEQMLTL